MRTIRVVVEASNIMGDTSYTWYIVKKKISGLELRAKQQVFSVGDVIGLRPSKNGMTTRLVRRGELTKVMSPDSKQVAYILARVEPLIGGPIDSAKVGHIVEPKIGIVDKRKSEGLEAIAKILSKVKDPSLDNVKLRDKRIYFTYNNKPYGVVIDPS